MSPQRRGSMTGPSGPATTASTSWVGAMLYRGRQVSAWGAKASPSARAISAARRARKKRPHMPAESRIGKEQSRASVEITAQPQVARAYERLFHHQATKTPRRKTHSPRRKNRHQEDPFWKPSLCLLFLVLLGGKSVFLVSSCLGGELRKKLDGSPRLLHM